MLRNPKMCDWHRISYITFLNESSYSMEYER